MKCGKPTTRALLIVRKPNAPYGNIRLSHWVTRKGYKTSHEKRWVSRRFPTESTRISIDGCTRDNYRDHINHDMGNDSTHTWQLSFYKSQETGACHWMLCQYCLAKSVETNMTYGHWLVRTPRRLVITRFALSAFSTHESVRVRPLKAFATRAIGHILLFCGLLPRHARFLCGVRWLWARRSVAVNRRLIGRMKRTEEDILRGCPTRRLCYSPR